MKQGTMNILFFVLKTKLLKNGEAPILMRITINGQYEEIRIQRSVPLKNWNPAKVHIPADTRSAFPVISVQSPVSIQCCWQS